MPIKSVDAKTLKKWLDSSEAMVVDVREPAEHEARKIKGATLIPLSGVCKKLLPDTGSKKLILHCGSGKRSANACEKLLAEDPNLEIYNLEGGISAWSEEGNPVIESGKFFLPLDRQVQLVIGITLMIVSLLGYLFTPLLFILTGFIGAGLAMAGITGFCGMAVVIAKMPWNQKSGQIPSCCSAH